MAQRAPEQVEIPGTSQRLTAQQTVRLRNVEGAGWQIHLDAATVRVERVTPTGQEPCVFYDERTCVYRETFPAWVPQGEGGEDRPFMTGQQILALWGSGRYMIHQMGADGRPLGRAKPIDVEHADHPPKPARCGGPRPAAPKPEPAAARPEPLPRGGGRAYASRVNLDVLDGGTVLALMDMGEDRATARHLRELDAAEARHRREMEHAAQMHSQMLTAQAQAFQLAIQVRSAAPIAPVLDQRLARMEQRIEEIATEPEEDDGDADAAPAMSPGVQLARDLLELAGPALPHVAGFVQQMMTRAAPVTVASSFPAAAAVPFVPNPDPAPRPPVVERVAFDPPPAPASAPEPPPARPVSSAVPPRPGRPSPVAILAAAAAAPPPVAAPASEPETVEIPDDDDEGDDDDDDEGEGEDDFDDDDGEDDDAGDLPREEP